MIQKLKNLLIRMLRRLLRSIEPSQEIQSDTKTEVDYSRRSYSQEGEDLLLYRFLEGVPNGFYVDVGANDPERFSNTKIFYDMGWQGVLIEPNPELEQRLRQNRPRDIVVTCGVSSVPSSLEYYAFDEPAMNTFCSNRADEVIEKGRYKLMSKKVIPVEPLSSILSKYFPEGKSIDFLSVDVEGLDHEVLLSHDWIKFPVTYVVVECFAEDLISSLECPSAQLLKSKGYIPMSRLYNSTLFKKS